MKTPSITPAQILALVTSLLGMLVTLGLIDDTTSQAIAGVASTALPMILVLADMTIRKARAENVEGILQAKAVEALATAKAAEAKQAEVEAARAPLDSDVEALGPYDGS